MRRLTLTIAALALCACPSQTKQNIDPGIGYDAGSFGGNAFAHTFTSKSDFQAGSYNGVSDQQAGDLTMAIGESQFATPYMWVPNSAENTISAIDTKTEKEVARIPLVDENGEPCYNPSRTTVDFNFNGWVGCRGENSYLASYGGEPINIVDVKVMKVSLTEKKVVKAMRVGHAPRALAFDANGHVWIGNSVDDSVWELDGDTGQCYRGEGAACPKPPVQLACDFPYGGVIDADQKMWVVCRGYAGQDERVAKFDTQDPTKIEYFGPFGDQTPSVFGQSRGGCTQLYGIAVDQLGDVWIGGLSCNDIIKLHGADGSLMGVKKLGGQFTRGVAIDLDGNAWAALSGTNTVTKVEGATGNLLKTVDLPPGPLGVSVDAYGHVWAVSQGANCVTKINGIDGTKTQVDIGEGPYSYSDMLGLSLRMVTLSHQQTATWRGVVDSSDPSTHFTTVKWTVDTPTNTSFAVRVRCAATKDALATAAFSTNITTSGAAVDSAGGSCLHVAAQEFLEMEARFTSQGTSASPTLHDITAFWAK
jgi:DNA-binding beta-propeller fold protein YncE